MRPSSPSSDGPLARPEDDPTRALYGITVASELVGTGPQNLRLYERRGLVEPYRTPGGTRRYSDTDLDRIRRIGKLLEDGVNLAGVKLVLDLEAANTALSAALVALEAELRDG
jgi:DNA-binding transcriptional MerR regulator